MKISHSLPAGIALAIAASALLTPSCAHAAGKDIAWQSSYQSALQLAKKTHKPLMLDFYTVWCSPCKQMEQTTFKDAQVVTESQKWIAVRVDGEKIPAAAKKYKVSQYPVVAFVKPDGTIVKRLDGFQNAKGVLTAMKAAYPGARK